MTAFEPLPYRRRMSCRVVCFSGPDGSHMRDVAASVATSLGFSLVDEAIIMRAAAEAGVDPQVVADVEQRRSFIDRCLGALTMSGDATAVVFTGGGGGYLPPEEHVSDELRSLIRMAIEETADRGNVVIVAHAASHALAGRDDVLRVLVTASPETRCAPHRGRAGSEREGRGPRDRRCGREPRRLPEAILRREGRAADAVRHRRQHRSALDRRCSRGGRSGGSAARRGNRLTP